MRKAIILDGAEPVNVIVIPEGADGDAMLSSTCVEITHLDPKPGLGNGWTYANGEFVPPPPPVLTYEEVRLARHAAYAAPDGPDAIFLQWQRGDATEQDWLDAVAAVKDAHPYPDAP